MNHQDLNNVNFLLSTKDGNRRVINTKQLENEFNRAVKTKFSAFLRSPGSFHILSLTLEETQPFKAGMIGAN